ncbi:membrane protein [Streptomyces sp. NRRL WC-3753]|nr:membrane protein [Streptomyces sp. NRRL WC-3753]
MRLPVELRHVAPRLATGAFILNSGLSKRGADEQTAAMMHGMAKNTYPFLGRMQPTAFLRLLSAGEITLGAALLLPVVPTAVAGIGLTTFSAALVGLYLRTPGMREEGSLRPTQEGTALAKDTWMLGIGVGFVVDGATRRAC